MGARTVDVNKTVKLDAKTYDATSSQQIKYKLGTNDTVTFDSPHSFTVSSNNTSFANKGGASITLTWKG